MSATLVSQTVSHTKFLTWEAAQSAILPTMGRRFQRSLSEMDANASDADGKWRLSTPARADYAFWNTFLAGWVGWAIFAVCAAALALLLIWLYA
jgi:hypothetical protein